jgi:tRNA(Arg) A34 adenosine deaminase TadA
MASLKGLASIVSELRVERTNLANQLRHVDAALSVLGQSNGGSSYAKLGRTLSDFVLYSTHETRAMCAGACVQI